MYTYSHACLYRIRLLINHFENWCCARGTPNDIGGLDYYYHLSSCTSEISQALTALVLMYRNGLATYYSWPTDSAGSMNGIITILQWQLAKVKTFYKPKKCY